MKLSPAQTAALLRTLHRMEGAEARWSQTIRPSDAELAERIGYEFGSQGGYCGGEGWIEQRGGAHPWISIKLSDASTIELSGFDLLAAVRETLQIGRPGELF